MTSQLAGAEHQVSGAASSHPYSECQERGCPRTTALTPKLAKYEIEVGRGGCQFDHIYARTSAEAKTAAEAMSLMTGVAQAIIFKLSDYSLVACYVCGSRTIGPKAIRRQFALDSFDEFEV